jgi:phage terminase large subunit
LLGSGGVVQDAVSCGGVEGHTRASKDGASRPDWIPSPEAIAGVEPGPQDTSAAPQSAEARDLAATISPVAQPTKPTPALSPSNGTNVWATLVATYRDRPIAFVEDLLIKNYPGFKLEAWQKTFLKAVGRGERRISVRAGHGVGKSAVCSFALLWHMFTRYPQKSILTAPTQSQLFDALFAEVKRWVHEMPQFMQDQVEVFADRIELRASPENSFMSARTSSAERPEALAGVHSDHVLLVVDEASAVPEPVFEAASGSMSGFTATTILISNPTRNTGLFFKTHHQLSSNWFRLHVSCLDSKLVAPDFIQQIKDTYGETSSAYYVRVLGEFAPREDDVLIPAELVDAAMARDVVLDTGEPLVYGLDVARFGDDRTVLCKRQGNVVIEIRAWSGADLMQTVGRVMHEADTDKPSEICVDSIGLGAGVADRLREQGLNVRDVNVSEVSALNPTAAKLRDELWLTVKEWLGKRSCRLPRSEDLRGELVGPTYTFLSNGKIKVEGKNEMKKRGLRSPDQADSLCLTFAGQAALVGGQGSFWIKGKPLLRSIRGVV